MARAPGKRRSAATKPAPAPHSPLYYSLHGLLHTVRVIQSHEDQLCTLLHELRIAGTLTPEAAAELRDLLEVLPTWEYQDDLEALRTTLAGDTTFAADLRKPSRAKVGRPARERAKPKTKRAPTRSGGRAAGASATRAVPLARKPQGQRAAKQAGKPASKQAGKQSTRQTATQAPAKSTRRERRR